jgi:hypothetical protein
LVGWESCLGVDGHVCFVVYAMMKGQGGLDGRV